MCVHQRNPRAGKPTDLDNVSDRENKILSTWARGGHLGEKGEKQSSERKGLRDWKLAVKRLGKSWYYALCMGLCNGTCNPTRERPPLNVVRRCTAPIGNSTTRTWTCDSRRCALSARPIFPAAKTLQTSTSIFYTATRHTRPCHSPTESIFPRGMSSRVTFLIVIRSHRHIYTRAGECVCVRRRRAMPHYAIREKPTFHENYVKVRIKKVLNLNESGIELGTRYRWVYCKKWNVGAPRSFAEHDFFRAGLALAQLETFIQKLCETMFVRALIFRPLARRNPFVKDAAPPRRNFNLPPLSYRSDEASGKNTIVETANCTLRRGRARKIVNIHLWGARARREAAKSLLKPWAGCNKRERDILPYVIVRTRCIADPWRR